MKTNLERLDGRSVPPVRVPGAAFDRLPERERALEQAELLHGLFERQAARRPDAIALEGGGTRVSYRQAELEANRLANFLLDRGIRPGDCVGLMLEPSPAACIALLAILKAGAAYVPIDAECPMERARFVLRDSRARALFTTSALSQRLGETACPPLHLDREREVIAAFPATRPPAEEWGLSGEGLCYVIYTSGTTGTPKGVMVEHRNVHHLVQAEKVIYGVRPEDRVYQGAPLSFDLSVEEMWMAWAAGATLVVAERAVTRSGPDLARFLEERRISVLSSVPTLLSTFTAEVPSLRLLILGGEACPDWVLPRFARANRRIINTYGPTETTVIATYAELASGRPVTLGRPVPGYRVHLLDEKLQLVPQGEPGEICIGGPGVARGYLGRAELTRERFVPDPYAPPGESGARLYRSGDLGRIDENGNLRFLGRNDDQVKLRGFRIELAEVEAAIAGNEGVLAAACAVHEDAEAGQVLVGYVVPRGAAPRPDILRRQLRDRLPAYMVPAQFETLAELPRLPSGKLDRKSLPAPKRLMLPRALDGRLPRDPTERAMAAAWQALFPSMRFSIDDDFFVDLGGHSLLAARLVSELRKQPRFAQASVADVYDHPTVAGLTAALVAREARPSGADPLRSTGPDPGIRRRHALAGLMQALGLYFSFGLRAFQWITPFLTYFILDWRGMGVGEATAFAALAAAAVLPLLFGIALAAKWLLLGRIRPGSHPLWGLYYLRWWFVESLVTALPLDYLRGTPLLPIVCRLFGARIGAGVHLETVELRAFDLVGIGAGTTIDEKAVLLGYTVEDGELKVGSVDIGRDCHVGVGCVLREDTALEDGACLEDLSLLPAGTRVPRGESWSGSPARRLEHRRERRPPSRIAPRNAATTALYGVLVFCVPMLPLAAYVPGIAILTEIDLLRHPLEYLAAAVPVGALFVLLLTAGVVLAKWALLGRVRAGSYPVHGSFYVRKWILDQLLALSLDVAGSLHATQFLPWWFRALGARLGRNVELSTVSSETPDLLDIGDGGTVADDVSLGAAQVDRGWMTLEPTRIGRRAFIGNSGVLQQGRTLGDGSLIGVLSVSPPDPRDAAEAQASWLGSPPIRLPRREPSQPFPDARTYEPPFRLRLLRGVFELLRITLPPAGFIMVTASVIDTLLALAGQIGLAAALAALPVLYVAACGLLSLAVVAVKWLVIGRYRAFERPLWSPLVWRLELVNALYEFMITPLALEPLHGTPFLPGYLRLLGARIGRRTYLHTTGFLEWDLVELGDDVMVNNECVIQTHLFEDRVLKVAALKLGDRCSLGAASVVLYGSEMQAGSSLDALSLLMKGERLPAGTRWAGSPARHLGDAPASARQPRETLLPALEAVDA